jgi:di/tricarboxylate transporter
LTFEIAFVFSVVVAALLLFASERFRADQVALAVPVVLLFGGVVTTADAVAGLSSPATVTVAAMLALSLGLTKTGVVDTLSRWALGAPLGGPRTRLLVLCLVAAAISPFLNNTAVVVVFLPVFMELARDGDQPSSTVLIPLSYSAILGGTVTLIGTSTNLIVYGMAESRGFDALGMFSIAPLGLIYLGVGTLYLFTVGRRLLPHRETPPDLSDKYEVRSFLTELRVQEGSPVAGRTLGELQWGRRYGVTVLGIQRESRAIPAPGARRPIRAGDILLARGDTRKLLTLARDEKLSPPSKRRVGPSLALRGSDAKLVELLVAPGSHMAGRTLAEVGFQQRHDAVVLAIQHQGKAVHERLPQVRLAVGDLLLVHGSARALTALAEAPGFVPMGEVERPFMQRPRGPVAVAILGGVVLAAGTGLVAILPAALAGVVLMVFTGCVRLEEIYQDLDWSVVFLLAGLIPLGIAMDTTGAAAWIGELVAGLLGPLPPVVAVGVFYLLTSLLTEAMSNNASAVVLTPIALVTAADLGMNPYALLVAVMFGASASFMTPVGYQTNALVYGPGGYRFGDFFKVGAPLNLILLVTASLLIPVFWPS